MKKPLVVTGIVLAVLAVVYIATSWFFSGLVVVFDTDTLAEEQVEHGAPADYGLPAPEEIVFTSDGETLAGWYFENPANGDCGAILLHGITGSRYGALIYAPLFWERGCDLMLYDHRYHGASSGDYGTYGFYEKLDALAAVDWLSDRTGLARDRIGLQGESYGAATALQAGALAPDLAFVAADSAYRDLETIVREQAGQQFGSWTGIFVPTALAISELRADFAASAVSPMTAVEEIRAPVFLSHSATDEFTLPHHSEDIFRHLPESICKRLHLTDWGSEHAASIDDNPAAYKAQFDEFLDACVPGFGISS